MNIYTIIEIIRHSEQRGVELLIDALIIGVEIGRGNLENLQQIEQVIESLKKLKFKIDLSIFSPFIREDLYDRVLNYKEKLDENLHDLQLEFQKQSKIKQMGNICQICNELVENDSQQQFITQCKHRFHPYCIIPLWNQGLNNQNSFKCPLCGQSNLQQALEKEIKNNLNLMKSCCPNPYCKKKFLYVGQETYRCSECKQKYCLQCLSYNHPINKCNQNQKNQTFQLGDNYKECPYCNKNWVKQKDQEKILNCSCKFSFCFHCGYEATDCRCNISIGYLTQSILWFKRAFKK